MLTKCGAAQFDRDGLGGITATGCFNHNALVSRGLKSLASLNGYVTAGNISRVSPDGG